MSSPNGAQAPTARHGVLIPIGLIDPQPDDLQRFDEGDPQLDDLVATLRQHGQLQAIVVRAEGERYRLIIGSRRWRAARALGWSQIRADILPAGTIPTTALTLTENLARKQLTPAEEAIGVAQMLAENDNDPAPVARMLGRSIRWIEQRAQLVHLPPELLAALHKQQIRIAHAQSLATVQDPVARQHLLQTVIEQTPPAHLVARWVDDANLCGPPSAQTPEGVTPDAGGRVTTPTGVTCACCSRTVPITASTALVFCLVCAEEMRTAVQAPPPIPTPPAV